MNFSMVLVCACCYLACQLGSYLHAIWDTRRVLREEEQVSYTFDVLIQISYINVLLNDYWATTMAKGDLMRTPLWVMEQRRKPLRSGLPYNEVLARWAGTFVGFIASPFAVGLQLGMFLKWRGKYDAMTRKAIYRYRHDIIGDRGLGYSPPVLTSTPPQALPLDPTPPTDPDRTIH